VASNLEFEAVLDRLSQYLVEMDVRMNHERWLDVIGIDL